MVQAPLSKLEYRRLFSELLGTFMLVLVAAGGGLLHGEGQISLPAAVVAPGLMVLAIILRGRGGDPISRAAGAGVLTPGDLEKKARLSRRVVAPRSPDSRRQSDHQAVSSEWGDARGRRREILNGELIPREIVRPSKIAVGRERKGR